MDPNSLLTDTPENLARIYYKKLLASNIPVTKLIIFGSYAKGTAKPYSDLDLCVVSPIFGKDRHNERLQLNKISLQIDSLIEPHPYSPETLIEKYDSLAEQIRLTGKTVSLT